MNALRKSVNLSLLCGFCLFYKVGTLRFCGSTEFAGGLWAGVELHQPVGKNDGSVAGVQYFTCPIKHGKSINRNVFVYDSDLPLDSGNVN